MTFQPYYSTPITDYLMTAVTWGFVTSIILFLIFALLMQSFRIDGKVLAVIIALGVFLGGGIGMAGQGQGDRDANVSIVRANIMKKYEVQDVVFDVRPVKTGGHGWSPSQSKPQQVVVTVNNTSHDATLTQNPQTAEPTLIDSITNKEISLRKNSSQ